jgi:hypothetical protein
MYLTAENVYRDSRIKVLPARGAAATPSTATTAPRFCGRQAGGAPRRHTSRVRIHLLMRLYVANSRKVFCGIWG